MPTLLHVDSSPMGEASISRRLTAEFVSRWRMVNLQGEVISRDLTTMHIPAIDADWVAANYLPPESRTPQQNQLLVLSNELAGDLLRADEYVFGVPMHNWGPASIFKLWADQIVRFGKTVLLTPSGMKGALDTKKITFFVSAGRSYRPGAEDASRNLLVPWLRTFFGSLGVTEMRFHFVDGAGALRSGQVDREAFLAPHLAAVQSFFSQPSVL
ncbi:MAG TPA: NAD(P)H-dependent oxidoreductase [Terracidiphilus sp.]|nr:NAD(P)H-dependent oxidoreductase [Terracidiphilus sp.]